MSSVHQTFHLVPKLVHPCQKALGESLGVQKRKDPTKRIVRGNAPRQLKERTEPFRFMLCKELHLRPVFRPAKGPQDGDDEDVQKLVSTLRGRPGVG